MQYAIELYFDQETEKSIFALASKIADAGISTKFMEWQTRPHITLACFNDVDEEQCGALLNVFAQTHSKKPAAIASVGMFPDTRTVFLSPMMTRDIYDLQRKLHACMDMFDTTGWEWYRPDRWAPHCTVALTRDDPADAFFATADLVLREFRKLEGTFTSVGLVKITFPVQEIHTVELN